MAINHGSLSANLTNRGVVGGRVQNSVLAYENDYENLINKPSINDTELNGDLSLEDLGIVNNVQPDWAQTNTEADDYINNKPDIPENLSDLNDDADHRTVSDTEKTTWDNKSDFSGSYNDLTDKPVIPDAQIQSDWKQNDNTKADYIKNKPSIPEYLKDLESDVLHRTVTDSEIVSWNQKSKVVANPGNTSGTLSGIGIDGTNYAIHGGGAVNSVNGKTGDVVLDAEDVGALPEDTSIPTALSDLSEDSTHRTVTDTEKSTWNAKSDFSGSYNDLSDKPTIPTVNNSTITIQKNGQNVDTFTLNQNTNKAIDISVPTKTSDITNDSSFITNTVNNLANYYLKSETYTKTEVSNLIDAAVNGRFEKVQTLPVTGEANVIYLVPKTTALTNNVYDEYIWQDNAWELLGSTEIDLSNYVTTTDLSTALADYVTSSTFNTTIANYYTKTEVGNLLDGKVDKVSGKGLSTYDYDATAKGIVDNVTTNLAGKVDKVNGKGLSTEDYTTTEKNKLAGISTGANKVESSTTNGNIRIDGTETQVYDGSGKVDKVNGKGLSTNDYDNTDKAKVDKIDTTTTSISGNPISISGLKSNQLAVNPIITFEPIQAGSGDPSPVNERPISGYDKIEVLSCGKNLFDKSKALSGKAINNTGAIVDLEYFYLSDFIPVKPNVTYYLTNGVGSSNYYTSAIFTKNKEFISELNAAGGTPTSGTMPIPSNAYYIRLNVPNAYIDSCQFEEGSSATPYEPYHKTTDLSLQLGQTVYGASYNVRAGKLTNQLGLYTMETKPSFNQSGTHKYVLYYPTGIKSVSGATDDCVFERLPFVSGIGDYFGYYHETNMIIVCVPDNYTIEEFNANIAGSKFTYPLATPTEIQLTPHEISLLKDYAYISTNGTSIALNYHNGELASLADVSQLGETVNELGNKTPMIINRQENFTSSTTASYTGVSILIEASKVYVLSVRLMYQNNQPYHVSVSEVNDSVQSWRTIADADGCYVSFVYSSTTDTTLYVWATYSGVGGNHMMISGLVFPIK